MSGATCVLCAIAARVEPGSFVHEDEDVVGIMSLDQPTPYKVLVLPRAHVETIYDLSDELGGALFRATARLARAVRAASGCSGLNLVQSNGRTAGQEVPHFHLHLVPRAQDDGIVLAWPPRRLERAELDALAADICRNIERAAA